MGSLVRLLRLVIHEPVSGVMPRIATEYGSREAVRRYQAIVITTLRQLRGMENTVIQIKPEPMDAEEAIRFWILPRLSERWIQQGARFLSDGWMIEFGEGEAGYEVLAVANPLCPMLSARWVHAALAGLDRGGRVVTGHDQRGQLYLSGQAVGNHPVSEACNLPQLISIDTADDWNRAVEGPLGPALSKELEKTI